MAGKLAFVLKHGYSHFVEDLVIMDTSPEYVVTINDAYNDIVIKLIDTKFNNELKEIIENG